MVCVALQLLFCVASAESLTFSCTGIFPLVHRTRIRRSYKLTGSLPGDVARACCCCCCAAIQNEREVRDMEVKARRWAGPVSADVYRAPDQMAYVPTSES